MGSFRNPNANTTSVTPGNDLGNKVTHNCNDTTFHEMEIDDVFLQEPFDNVGTVPNANTTSVTPEANMTIPPRQVEANMTNSSKAS
jgi:hypothetical protein